MQVYTHLKNYVILTVLEHDFISYLLQENIPYRVLPVILDFSVKPEEYIVKYKSFDNMEIYVVVLNRSGSYYVLFTECVPEDGWNALVSDVCAQMQYGCDERDIHSFTYIVLQRILDKICMDRCVMFATVDKFDPYIRDLSDYDRDNIIEQIAEYGITKENIRAFGIWDINIKLLKWLGFIEK